MINSLLIVDNVFDDPDRILDLARSHEYYPNQDSELTWQGIRSKELISYDHITYSNIVNTMINKGLEKTFGTGINVDFKWYMNLYFHQLFAGDVMNDDWFHTDKKCCYAGVVYLSKNPPEDSGTVVNTGKEILNIENVFNRMILYRSDFNHSAKSGFGNSIEDSRLTLTFFVTGITINVEG
jgi:hypothetical protein